MKKFSVLLIVVLFFVPVFVYGLTGSSLTKPIGLVGSIRKFAPVAKVLSLKHKNSTIPSVPEKIMAGYPDGFYIVEFGGILKRLDRPDHLTILFGEQEIKMSMNDLSKCFSVAYVNEQTIPTFLGFKTIPDWIKVDTLVRGNMIVIPGKDEYIIDNIYFSKFDEE